MDNENELENILDEIGDPLSGNEPVPIDITKIEPPLIEEPAPQSIVPAPPAEVQPAPPAEVQPTPPADGLQIDASQLLKQYLTVYEKFLNNYDDDRAQIERTIKHLENVVFNIPGAPRVNLEMLVAAQRTKAETNGNIVKALDSIAKILAAAKGTQVLINNNNNGSAQLDLAKILSSPLYPDEKR